MSRDVLFAIHATAAAVELYIGGRNLHMSIRDDNYLRFGFALLVTFAGFYFASRAIQVLRKGR